MSRDLYAAVFVTGAAVLLLEILGTRIIAPVYGTTLYVWSSLITVTLVFLALGYYVGGKLADRRPLPEYLYGIIALAGVTVLIIPIIDAPVLAFSSPMGSRAGSMLASLFIFGLPLGLLGMVSPYIVRLISRQVEAVGTSTGNVYAFGTVGSFLGAIVTGFYLIPTFPISSILYATGGGLLLIPSLWFVVQKGKRGAPVLVASALLLAVLPLLPAPSYGDGEYPGVARDTLVLYEKHSAYSQIKVVEWKRWRYLLIDNLDQDCMDIYTHRDCDPYSYTILMENSRLLIDEPGNCLFIGLGAGISPSNLQREGLDVDVVEIDPEIATVAKIYFNFSGNVIIDDGRHYLRTSGRHYDLIINDAFTTEGFQSTLVTVEALNETKNALNENGVFCLNTIGDIKGNNASLQAAIYRTMKEVFPYVYPVQTHPQSSLVLFYGSRKPIKGMPLFEIDYEGEVPIITDESNPLDIMRINSLMEHRRTNRWLFGDAFLFQ